jgi:hypothetical protein
MFYHLSVAEVLGLHKLLDAFIKENDYKEAIIDGAHGVSVTVNGRPVEGVLVKSPDSDKPQNGLDKDFNSRLLLRLLELHDKKLKRSSKSLHISEVIRDATIIDIKTHHLAGRLKEASLDYFKALPKRRPRAGAIAAKQKTENN